MKNSNKLKRINKMKMITLWVICALVALFFKFSMVMPTYAYYVNSDGNLVSQNLLNMQYDNTINGVNLKLDSTSVTINGNNTGSSDLYYYVNLFSDLEINQTYTLSFDTNISLVYDTWLNGNRYMCADNQPLTITLTNELKNAGWRFVVHTGNYNNSVVNIMLNDGSSALNYEPYGIWISQSNVDYNNSLLANMGLMQYLFYMQVTNVISREDIEIDGVNEFTKDYLIDNNLISASGVLNLNYFNTNTLNPNYNPYRITFYFDDNIPLNLFNLAFQTYSSGTMTLIGNGTYIIQITSDTLSYDSNLINNTSLTYIEEIVIEFDSADALSNINFNSYSIVNYNNGYNYGYNVGDSVGYQRGYNEGNSVGYQRGYNEGIEQDFENTGFKTLITTILSYPVNMVRESLNFEFMGIHIASIVLFIVSLGIVAFVIKRFKD